MHKSYFLSSRVYVAYFGHITKPGQLVHAKFIQTYLRHVIIVG